MNIAILGYGDQGKSAYEYWNRPGNTITICDINNIFNELPPGVHSKLGGDYLMDLEVYDLLVRSPSIHPKDIIEANPDHPEVMGKVTSVTNEFMNVCPAPVIGVTGTKGKGTTSTLITKILEAAGYKVHLGGNIGTPPLELLKNKIQPTDWVVLELANFQLIDLKKSPAIGVCLMVAPEHLDWHKDMFEYVRAKQQMFVHQTSNSLAIYNASNSYSQEIAEASPGAKIVYDVPPVNQQPDDTRGVYVDGNKIIAFDEQICNIDDVALLGRHNLENVCAAIAATWEMVQGKKHLIKKVVKNFAGLEHRIEIIKKINDVFYVDDSFGTTPETAVVAVEAFKKPKVMIVGGSDKGANYDEMAHAIANGNVRHVVAIGQTGPAIISAIQKYAPGNRIGFSNLGTNVTMNDIVSEAASRAQKGDVVLLSTGCASFGMFKNYKDRGEQFKQSVQALVPAAK